MKYFVLNPSKQDWHGQASRAAMLAYAERIEATNSALAADLRAWARRHEPVNDERPGLGSPWPGQGGIYVGILRGRNGAADYHLVLAEGEAKEITWQGAINWAGGIDADGHRDFSLPNRAELSLLYANAGESFEKVWYWSSEQYVGDDEFAWCQDFYYGLQSSLRKSAELRARAVRRIPID